jgi:hypothetical protein
LFCLRFQRYVVASDGVHIKLHDPWPSRPRPHFSGVGGARLRQV